MKSKVKLLATLALIGSMSSSIVSSVYADTTESLAETTATTASVETLQTMETPALVETLETMYIPESVESPEIMDTTESAETLETPPLVDPSETLIETTYIDVETITTEKEDTFIIREKRTGMSSNYSGYTLTHEREGNVITFKLVTEEGTTLGDLENSKGIIDSTIDLGNGRKQYTFHYTILNYKPVRIINLNVIASKYKYN